MHDIISKKDHLIPKTVTMVNSILDQNIIISTAIEITAIFTIAYLMFLLLKSCAKSSKVYKPANYMNDLIKLNEKATDAGYITIPNDESTGETREISIFNKETKDVTPEASNYLRAQYKKKYKSKRLVKLYYKLKPGGLSMFSLGMIGYLMMMVLGFMIMYYVIPNYLTKADLFGPI
ncbi:hypothetical protein NEOKW01_1407 [Nematocida sp. AWRm80]|nr:hypothetical protein NEOKW01_1407 [Nematocida sp. AWRm80]